MSIGKNIKQIRIDNQLTQKQLAKIAGVTDKAVSMWEMEKREPRMGAIQKIADFFGIAKSTIIDEPPFEYSPYKHYSSNNNLTNCNLIDDFSFDYYNTTFNSSYHPSDNFCLVQTKDNMAPFILNGDKIIIEANQNINKNLCCAVIIDQSSASIHRVKFNKDGFELISDNPYFPKQFFGISDKHRVKFIGEVKKIIREL